MPIASDRSLVESLKALAEARGWEIQAERAVPHGRQVRLAEGSTAAAVTFYDTGRVLVQGCPSQLRSALEEWMGRGAQVAEPAFQPHVGIDESGKGAYFGPLVIAAVYVNRASAPRLVRLGVRDSKDLADRRIHALADYIESGLVHSVVEIGPARYNQLRERFGNLNRLLAWGHARALENVLEKVKAGLAVADQFGDESLVEKALLARGRKVRLEQRHRAEEDIAVAAASILARSRFLRRLETLSRQAGVQLPKGASSEAERAARAIVEDKGADALGRFAKLHFATTRRVLGRSAHDTG